MRTAHAAFNTYFLKKNELLKCVCNFSESKQHFSLKGEHEGHSSLGNDQV